VLNLLGLATNGHRRTNALLAMTTLPLHPPYRIINQLQVDDAAERARLIAGLNAPAASISPKYFYDELGCALYAAICRLDEYYPTRTERAIFSAHREAIASAIGAGGMFVDLGAGDCCKALSWLPILQPDRYLAVDIAGPSLDVALANMAPEFPETEMLGLVTDFSQSLDIPPELLKGKVTLFYPGSSIGNFTPQEAVRFLQEMRRIIGSGALGGSLLIGVDAKKDPARLDAAYADALGVTAAFNLNALRHINRVIGANFVEADWQHVGRYNAEAGRVEMFLEARRAVSVSIGGQARAFAAGERIHTENSCKYTGDEFHTLLAEAGFASVQRFSDAGENFFVFVAK
jgi:dimethylhistidine N-methyltransferase